MTPDDTLPPETGPELDAAAVTGNIVSITQAAVDGAQSIRQAWFEKYGTAIDTVRLVVLGGQVWGESQFGRAVQGYRPIEWGTNNYGSIQATPAWQRLHNLDDGWGYILLGDVHADGTPYVYPYRLYPVPIDAARDWLSLITSYVSQADMLSPTALATALKHKGYYEAPVDKYIAMITGGSAVIQRGLSSGLPPGDPNSPTGDAFPPNAFDGQHLPGRVTFFPLAPTPEPYDLHTVRGYQAALTHLSVVMGIAAFSPRGVDGRYGPLTKEAVKAFQSYVGIAADGIVGPITIQALTNELRSHT